MRPSIDPGPIVIVGAGGFGRECLDIVEALNDHGAALEFVGFVDDGGGDDELLQRRHTVCLGPTTSAPHGARFVIAIGDGAVRDRIARQFADRDLQAAVLIHPQATLGSDCRIGAGTILNAGARVTTNITLGRHVQLHANSTVGHDATLADFVSVFPGATISGSVTLGEGVTVGTGANVLPGVRVGRYAFVGAGAVVTGDVEPGATVVGVPATALPGTA
ncbi:acetyltransferase [Ilumatobacter sp.]|uniref:acetyltransferase n=1 Tax=Ilumatobacter sp. TaxID=1967498 RepID=UPI003AF534B0